MSRDTNLGACSALTPPAHRLITVIGAGGKTSLINWIARYRQSIGHRVVITTTTKILPLHDTDTLFLNYGSDIITRLRHTPIQAFPIVVAGHRDRKTGKLIGIAPEIVDALHESGVADTILVEADGAARKPLKAPASHEPVIPSRSDICIGVMGLDAAFRPLTEAMVHRHEIFSSITGAQAHEPVTPAHMLGVATAPDGFFKNCPSHCKRAVFLNKADIPNGQSLVSEFERAPSLAAWPQIAWFAGSCRRQAIHLLDSQSIMPHAVDNPLELTSRL